MDLKMVLIGYLPTKWSQAIAGSTLVLAGIELWLPQSLPPSIAPLLPKSVLTYRTTLVLSTLFLGTLITLLLVVVAYHRKIKEFNTTKHDKTKEKVMKTVENQAEKILDKLSRKSSNPPSRIPDFTNSPEYKAIKPKFTSGGD